MRFRAECILRNDPDDFWEESSLIAPADDYAHMLDKIRKWAHLAACDYRIVDTLTGVTSPVINKDNVNSLNIVLTPTNSLAANPVDDPNVIPT